MHTGYVVTDNHVLGKMLVHNYYENMLVIMNFKTLILYKLYRDHSECAALHKNRGRDSCVSSKCWDLLGGQ